MDTSIIRTGIPAVAAALVLAISILFPAAASQGNRHGDDRQSGKCGYGVVGDQDESDPGGNRGGGDKIAEAIQSPAASGPRQSDKSDVDCGEDEDDAGESGGGGQSVRGKARADVAGVAALGHRSTIGGDRLGGNGE